MAQLGSICALERWQLFSASSLLHSSNVMSYELQRVCWLCSSQSELKPSWSLDLWEVSQELLRKHVASLSSRCPEMAKSQCRVLFQGTATPIKPSPVRGGNFGSLIITSFLSDGSLTFLQTCKHNKSFWVKGFGIFFYFFFRSQTVYQNYLEKSIYF